MRRLPANYKACGTACWRGLPWLHHAQPAAWAAGQVQWRNASPSDKHPPRRLHTQASAEGVLQRIAQQQGEAATRPPRFYVSPGSLGSSTRELLLEGEEARHALRVLRLREGDAVELCDGVGQVMLCNLSSADKARHQAWVTAVTPVQTHPWRGPVWCLAVACTTLKGGRAEWLVEKATELGAWQVIPVITERSQPGSTSAGNKYKRKKDDEEDGDTDYQPSRLERVAIAATKQCLREHCLKLHTPLTVQQLATQWLPHSECALLAVAAAPPVSSVLASWASSSAASQPEGAADAVTEQQKALGLPGPARLLMVGPEGDWTPSELALLMDAGASPVGLGSNRLRTETAAIALLAACSVGHSWQL